MSLQEIQLSLKNQLKALYDSIELQSIVNILIEEVTGWDKLQQNMHKSTPLREEQITLLQSYKDELLQGRPIQYVIQKAWFMGKAFFVNEQVLIPRPETEELVEWVMEYAHIVNKPLDMVDIGTGSGCIAISLANALPDCHISGIDISKEAINIAQMNAQHLGATVSWIELDILHCHHLPKQFDVMVSNPPYIPYREKQNMQAQVINHEPSIALFVDDTNPLIFYATIAALGKQALRPNGQIFFEIHYDQGQNMLHLLDEMGYHAELRQDMYGKDRMVRASLK